MDLQHYIQEKRKRGECYRLLAACFYMPQKQLFHEEKLFENLSDLFNLVCPEAGVFATQMKEAIADYSEEELSIEYAKLFVGPFELGAAPYGSIYLDAGKNVMGDSTMETAKIYKETGLTLDKNFKELPDHIAVELEFIYFLIYRELEELEKSRHEKALFYIEKQKSFFNDFLVQWVPPFSEKIKKATSNRFYRALAQCLLSFIEKTDFKEPVSGWLQEKTSGV